MPSSTNKAAAIHNDHENLFIPLDKARVVKAPMHFGTAFSPAKGGWNSSIWANSGAPNTFTEGPVDAAFPPDQNCRPLPGEQSFGGKTGSASLWSTSESDAWNGRAGIPWSASSTQPSPAMSRNSSYNMSPIRQRKGEQGIFIADLNGSTLPLASASRPNFGQMADHPIQNSTMDSTSGLPTSTTSPYPTIDDPRSVQVTSHPIPNTPLAGTAFASSASSANYFANTTAPRSARDPAIFGPVNASRQTRNTRAGSEFRPSVVPSTQSVSHNAASRAVHRPGYSTDSCFNNQVDHVADTASSGYQYGELESEVLNSQSLYQHSQASRLDHIPAFCAQLSSESAAERSSRAVISNDRFSSGPVSQMADGGSAQNCDQSLAYHRSTSMGYHEMPSSGINQIRHQDRSPATYGDVTTTAKMPNPLRSSSIGSLPSTSSINQMTMLERKLQGLQPFQLDHPFPQSNILHLGSTYPQPSPMPYPMPMAMNPLARPYAMPTFSSYSNVPTGPGHHARDRRIEHESVQVARSQLLEEFRTNSKTNRRCELRDVYNHVVEFSGDQYGSRFIQQKLETANSDEKEQIFSEILPNAIQLMTDIFGNYVIQKLFEHGNQTQKKILANQMKGRVLALSMQSFGCRVVQKALEHVLVDQQASIVKELESSVLKCVSDQNGNHVIQKAVERVPGQHIQFIIDDFKEQIYRLATHAYGCRVIQRMLEHCDHRAQRSILDELLGCVPTLIFDQFGNYVIQHVIVNGAEEDRFRIVAVVISQLFIFSKHKFASNVVEKSIDYGEAGQRAEILRLLTTPTEDRGNPALSLVGDSYGNYVIQKVLGHLRGPERESLVEQIRAHMVHLRRNHNPKQVTAIEKLIYSIDTDSNPNASSQSSSLPSTNASTVEGPAGNLQPAVTLDSQPANTPTPLSALP